VIALFLSALAAKAYGFVVFSPNCTRCFWVKDLATL